MNDHDQHDGSVKFQTESIGGNLINFIFYFRLRAAKSMFPPRNIDKFDRVVIDTSSIQHDRIAGAIAKLME
jgi:hypothetical protein